LSRDSFAICSCKLFCIIHIIGHIYIILGYIILSAYKICIIAFSLNELMYKYVTGAVVF
jgi:hypothetical protein